MASTQPVFPFLPQYTTWEDWNGNLIMYYGQELIPYTTEDQWQSTAKSVSQSPTFSAYPVPDPDQYDHWEDWVNQFVLIINGPSS